MGVIERPCTERARVSHSCRRIGAEVVRPTGTERGANVGLNVPAVEVRFEDVNAEAGVYVGMRALPTFLNFTRNSLAMSGAAVAARGAGLAAPVSDPARVFRRAAAGPRPGASKSTLMQVLPGCPDKSLKVSGSVTYNRYVFSEFVPERTVVYMPQNDKHIGEMTVRETLDFAAHLQGPWLRKDLVAELEKREGEQGIVPDPTMDAITKAMALEGNPTNVITDYVLKGQTTSPRRERAGQQARGHGQPESPTTAQIEVREEATSPQPQAPGTMRQEGHLRPTPRQKAVASTNNTRRQSTRASRGGRGCGRGGAIGRGGGPENGFQREARRALTRRVEDDEAEEEGRDPTFIAEVVEESTTEESGELVEEEREGRRRGNPTPCRAAPIPAAAGGESKQPGPDTTASETRQFSPEQLAKDLMP
ncbi:unnamed protein product [Closterium sp. Naga37s-1]|nr:unnamed protein product [Closterium sp. Naga37s-1]